MSQPSAPLDRVTSIKVKLGLLVAVSVLVAAVLGTVSDLGGVPPWLAIPVTVLLALALTQLLATGMTSPLRQMTEASRRMARGDYATRVSTGSTDEVGELARAFNTMAADLAAVDQQRRDLVATVSHELRTPLAGLIAVLENLEDGVVPTAPAGIRTALAQAERLSDLVRDLLDLSRVESGAVPLASDDVLVSELLERAVAEAGTLGRPVTYDVRVDPPDLRVTGDRARLHQLLSNLLDNASRHSTPGGAVRVSSQAVAPDVWRLEVANPGEPVAPEDRERAFERFGRLSDPAGGGTGLGLAIARWVVDLHGGSLGFVEPAAGETGARVVADLPQQPPTRTAPAPRGEPVTQTAVTTPVVPPVVAPNPHGLAPSWWTLDATPGRPRLLLASAVVGLLAALLVADHVPGFGYVLVLLAGGAVVWAATGWRRDPFTVACGLLAAALVAVLMIRAAEWIGILCALAATVLCLVGTTRARTFAGIAFTGLLWPFTALHSLPWLGRTIRAMGGRGHGLSVARTVALSLVGVVAFGLLFASADALFASWVGAIVPDLGDALLLFRIFVGVAVGGLVLATSYLALNPPAVDGITGSTPRPVQRRYEWLVPVLLVDLVFVAFLAAQATAFFGGHDFVRRTTGLTYADYVHQGFGQLTVATVLTLIVVSIGFRKAPRATTADRAWLRGSLGLLCALTLVVVASALHRMDLYQEAYGFSRLRLLVDAFEIWLGLLVVAVVVAGIRLRGSWLPRLALLSGATVLLVLAVSNPDARIAQHNVERWQETGKIDVAYLDGLSDDATPALLDLPRNLVSCLRLTSDATPFWDWNLGRQHARDALAAAPVSTPPCAESGPRA